MTDEKRVKILTIVCFFSFFLYNVSLFVKTGKGKARQKYVNRETTETITKMMKRNERERKFQRVDNVSLHLYIPWGRFKIKSVRVGEKGRLW